MVAAEINWLQAKTKHTVLSLVDQEYDRSQRSKLHEPCPTHLLHRILESRYSTTCRKIISIRLRTYLMHARKYMNKISLFLTNLYQIVIECFRRNYN